MDLYQFERKTFGLCDVTKGSYNSLRQMRAKWADLQRAGGRLVQIYKENCVDGGCVASGGNLNELQAARGKTH